MEQYIKSRIKGTIVTLAIGIIMGVLIKGKIQIMFFLFALMIIEITKLIPMNDRTFCLINIIGLLAALLMSKDIIEGQFRFGIIVIYLIIVLCLVTSKKILQITKRLLKTICKKIKTIIAPNQLRLT